MFSRPGTELGSCQPIIKRTIDVRLWKSSSKNSSFYYESCHNHNQPLKSERNGLSSEQFEGIIDLSPCISFCVAIETPAPEAKIQIL